VFIVGRPSPGYTRIDELVGILSTTKLTSVLLTTFNVPCCDPEGGEEYV
jgi:hypothetical protein